MRKHLYWASLASLLTLTACTPALLSFAVPSQVRPGSIFEVAVVGDSEASTQLSNGDAGCVMQIPNGFTIVGYRIDQIAGSASYSSLWNDPLLLSAYTAEPGYYLTSLVGTSPGTPTSGFGRFALKLYLQAPAAGASQHFLKVALVGGSYGNWTAVEPAGVTQFSLITTAPHSYPLDVVPGATATDFELDAASLPFGTLAVAGGPSTQVYGAVFGDVNQDGNADILGGAGSGLKVLQSNPGQAWTSPSTGLAGQGYSYSVPGAPAAFGDFDGDGSRDFVLADGRTFFGNGGTVWTPGAALLTGTAAGVAAGDTNGDGRTDVLLCASNGAMRLYRGNADRTFTQANNGLPTLGNGTAEGVLLADLTGDGNLDVYATRSVTPNVWIGDGSGNWTAGSGLPPTLQRAVAGDIAGDTAAEIVLVGRPNDTSFLGVQVYGHQGNGVFAAQAGTGLPTTVLSGAVAVLDFDGDGQRDIVLGLQSDGSMGSAVPLQQTGLQVWRNTGSGQFQLRSGTGLSAFGNVERILSADFDGDGAPDLGVVSSGYGVTLYRNARAHAITRIAHGCGVQAINSTGSGALGTSFTTTLTNTTGVPFLGIGFSIAPTSVCGSCVRGHEWGVVLYGTANVVSIPNAPAFSGLAIGIQGLDLLGTSGCAVPPVALTDTMVMTIQ
jgi:hypothetical protein